MGHGAIVVTHPTAVDQYSQQNELRFGSQDAVFHWNTDSDAANIPVVGPGDASSVGVTANTWYCIELTINTNGHLNVSMNGNDIAGLTEDGVADDQHRPGLGRQYRVADALYGLRRFQFRLGQLRRWPDDDLV